MKRPMLLCGIAEENATANANATESMTITAIATVLPTETTLVEPKFRVGPTVTLHPVNDVVDKSQNGLVELHMDNPSLNYVTFNVDARISVLSGIHVYGEGFGQAGLAGNIYVYTELSLSRQERLRQFISILKEIKLD